MLAATAYLSLVLSQFLLQGTFTMVKPGGLT
jgi:hypothetical protein